jgi:hypothetical protein
MKITGLGGEDNSDKSGAREGGGTDLQIAVIPLGEEKTIILFF